MGIYYSYWNGTVVGELSSTSSSRIDDDCICVGSVVDADLKI